MSQSNSVHLAHKMHRLLRVLLSIANLILLIQLRILSLIYYKKPQSIPPITDSFYTLSATTLARKIRQKEITCYEVVTAYVERIKTVNPYLNAVIEARFEDAIIEAKICDKQLKSGKYDVETLEKEKPLFGIPFTVKECCCVKGLSYTACTLARKDVKATEDGVAVEQLRNAGGIPLCVTNMPEMCASINSTNLLFGTTYNPYDTRYTAGGSSGGEAALLGAGASLIGIGSDMAGSLRMPASVNGIFGHKPTPGIISTKGHFPQLEDETISDYLTVGPLTRYAEDLSLVMKAFTLKYDRDLRLNAPIDLKHFKIYYRKGLKKTFGMLSVKPEIEQCVLKVIDHFSQCDIRTEELSIEWPKAMLEITLAYYMKAKNPPALLISADDQKSKKDPRIELAKALFGQSQHTKIPILLQMMMDRYFFSETQISHYVQQGHKFRESLLNLLGENEVFICPTLRSPATFSQPMILEMWNSLPYTMANFFGLSSTHIPMGLNHDGLPIGVQVIAAPYQDRLCLEVASRLEKAFGGWVQPWGSGRKQISENNLLNVFE